MRPSDERCSIWSGQLSTIYLQAIRLFKISGIVLHFDIELSKCDCSFSNVEKIRNNFIINIVASPIYPVLCVCGTRFDTTI